MARDEIEQLNLDAHLIEHDVDENSAPYSQVTEDQLILLCLDHLRDLKRSFNTAEAMSTINLDNDFVSLAIFALSRAFLSPSILALENDPFVSANDNFLNSEIYNNVTFGETQTTLPSVKEIEKTILNEKNDYSYRDSHQSNHDRFFHLNGLASGSPHSDGSSGGPISLKELTNAGLSGLGARSRGDAENEMVEGPLFEQFLDAVEEKGFFHDGKGKQMKDSSDAYKERYRKVVSKFRSKLAGKAEKALADSYIQAHHQGNNAITPPNIINVSSDASWSFGIPNNQHQLFPNYNSSVQPSSSFTPQSIPKRMNNKNPNQRNSLQANELDVKEAEQLKTQGNQHMQAKAYSRAIESYTAALKILPSGPTSHVYFSNRAAAFLSLKQHREAIHDSERSLALKPDYGKAHARLGLAHFLMENYEAAVEAYTNALKYESDNKSTIGFLEKAKKKLLEKQKKQKHGNTKESKGQISTTKSDFPLVNDDKRQRIIEQREADKFKVDGNNLMSQKKYLGAVECYSSAISLCPRGPSSHVYYSNRAAALCYLERYSEAAKDSEFSLQLNPDYGKAYARLGLSRFFLEDYGGAVEAYNTALKLDPNNTACISYLAKAEKKLREKDTSFHSPGRSTKEEYKDEQE